MASKENIPKNSENLGKAKWDDLSTKTLLEICMNEIRNCGKPGIAFKHKKWEEIREEFKKRNIDADSAWWEAKIRENVKYAKFRYQGLEFRNELEYIFGETVATSQTAWSPAMGVPPESMNKNTTANVTHEIIESDDELDNDDLSPMRNTQSKNKRKVSPNLGEASARGKTKIGTAPAMRKTLEQLVEAAKDHNEVEKAEIEARSNVNGQYSIPACVAILKSAKEDGFLNGQQFIYALEMLKDEQNRVLMMSLKESMYDLIDWILHKYK
ncbi:hypothetical protein QL285_042714 [Trifolium repens]|nr:hypothetical protein QL285_042714 [Trifolium repens]